MIRMPKKYDYDWNALIQEQKVSGLNVTEFCKRKGFCPTTYKKHAKVERNRNNDVIFLPVQPAIKNFINLRINGFNFQLEQDIDELFLQKILKALTT